jgi:surface carbohydrate biosynthesis protein
MTLSSVPEPRPLRPHEVAVSDRRWLILPVETKARELHAKMLLALIAAERGWGVLIGNKSALRSAQADLPRGTFLEKGVAPATTATIKFARSVGNRVSALCEEGLLYLSQEDYGQRRLAPQSVAALDFFFAWGARQADDVVAVMERDRDKVVISGNPRLDLLRPEWRGIFDKSARAIRDRFGPTILVNTKFALVNNAVREIRDYTDHLKAAGKIKSKEHEQLWRRYAAVQQRVLPCFLDLLPILSKEFPDHTIIVRPHPSERDEPWIKKAAGLPNVRATYGGNVHEWILAADAVIQNNCTTGIEAFLLDKPTISYRPFKDDGVELELPDRVSLKAQTAEELVLLVHGIVNLEMSSDEDRSMKRAFARQYIANIDGRLACDTIMDSMERLDLPLSGGLFPIRPRGIVESMGNKLKSRLPALKSMLEYNHKKFPGLEVVEMRQLLDDFRAVSGRFSDVTITQAMDGGFCVYRP